MWLQDPYVIEDLLRRRAELVAASLASAPRDGAPRRPSPFSRIALAMRLLIDARFAARVADGLLAVSPGGCCEAPACAC